MASTCTLSLFREPNLRDRLHQMDVTGRRCIANERLKHGRPQRADALGPTHSTHELPVLVVDKKFRSIRTATALFVRGTLFRKSSLC
jgi:hypothetical protein